jgi:molybdate transport system substrate-binding protein
MEHARVPRRVVLLAGVLSALAVVTGASAAAPRVRLTIYAAADLAFALKEIAAAFERTFNVDVILVFGSTGNLAHQIEHGAPADLFFAASDTFIDRLVERGAVLRETRAIYAQGRIVLATARSAGTKLTDLRQLAEPRVRRVAIANPLHAPYGKAAKETLQRAGVLDVVRPKLILAENIRQALQFLQTGNADAGIVALSVAGVPEIEWVPIDPALHNPLNQAVAVVRRSAQPDLASAFIQFVNGRQGRPVMKRFGFVLPGES